MAYAWAMSHFTRRSNSCMSTFLRIRLSRFLSVVCYLAAESARFVLLRRVTRSYLLTGPFSRSDARPLIASASGSFPSSRALAEAHLLSWMSYSPPPMAA